MQPHRSHQRWDVWVMLPAAFASLWIAGAAHAAPAVTITPEIKSPGNTISPDFCGLSFETKMLLPNGGQYFFRADNTELISLFKSLGVKSLRIGGNSADAPTVDIPTEPDLDQLCAFAQAAGVHLIYNLRLRDQTDPAGAIRLVKYLMDHHKPLINSFTIGNEPNVYFTEYSAYRDQWKKFADAILAAVPDAQCQWTQYDVCQNGLGPAVRRGFCLLGTSAVGHAARLSGRKRPEGPGSRRRSPADPITRHEQVLRNVLSKVRPRRSQEP